MRNDFVMPGGQWMTIPAPQKMAQLDQQITELVNGDDGGTWSPTKPIAIGGAGLSLIGNGSGFTGGVRTGKGYTSSSKPRVVLPPLKHVNFSVARTRKIILHPQVELRKDALGKYQYDRNAALLSSLSGLGLSHLVTVPQMRFHNRATITSVVFRWQLMSKPASVPGTPEYLSIFRMKKGYAGYPTIPSYLDYMHTDAAGSPTYASGGAFNTYATVDDYWNSGQVKSLTFAPNQNNVIDSEAYVYAIYLQTAAAVRFHSIELNLSNILTQRPE